ncbi:MAG: NosD domain-containing protein [Saprospiraceae bacterium]|jgi:parallel beta-helix repeat protein|nr:NosD domain-containing protein [Saprospiraceae bacterium]
MKFKMYFFSALLCTAFFSCSENANLDLPTDGLDPEAIAFIDNAIAELEADNDQPPSEEASNRSVVYVKAGSKDALADAITEAGVGGKVMFKSGTHYLSQGVTVTHSVRIEGESGAVIKTNVDAPSIPVIYVNGAVNFRIKNLEFQRTGEQAGSAIMLDEADFARIEGLVLKNYGSGIFSDKSNLIRIFNNTISGPANFSSTSGIESCISLIDGKKAKVYGNTISSADFGIYLSGEKGVAYENTVFGCIHGLTLGQFPFGFARFPDLPYRSSEKAEKWVIKDNLAQYNAWGYLFGNGGNNSYVYNNDASNNQVYDFELAGETSRFGFVAPTSKKILFSAGKYKKVAVKDCGESNQVFGGEKVDTGIYPCF